MKTPNRSHMILSLFFIFCLQIGHANEQTDLSNFLSLENPDNILSLAETMNHSSATYGDYQTDTYYNFESPSFKLLGFTLDDCTIGLIDKKVSHIFTTFKGDKNSELLIDFLTKLFDDAKKTETDGRIVFEWLNNGFVYTLTYTNYNESYRLNISDEAYRKLNEFLNG